MIVYLTRKHRIVADDGRNFTLEFQRISEKTKQSVWEAKGHYPNLAQAAQGALNKALGAIPQGRSIEALVEAIGVASERIAQACEGAQSASQAAAMAGVFRADDVPDDLFDLETGS